MPTFIAFINTKRARERGIPLESIVGPYQILNDPELGAVFSIPPTEGGKERLEQSPEYQQYLTNPLYVRTTVSGN